MTKIKKLTFESVNPLTSKQMKLIVGGSGAEGGCNVWGPCSPDSCKTATGKNGKCGYYTINHLNYCACIEGG